MRLIGAFIITLLFGAVALTPSLSRAQDTGWVIDQFHADLTLQPDATIIVVESIDVDFGALQRHGIFRDLPDPASISPPSEPSSHVRVFSVSDGDGASVQFQQTPSNGALRLTIGDPNQTVSGVRHYRIAYTEPAPVVALPDHDEVRWNVNGPSWPVPTTSASASVRVQGHPAQQGLCYQGRYGSTETCTVDVREDHVDFATTRPVQPGEQLTVAVAVPKGVFPAAISASPFVPIAAPATTAHHRSWFASAFDVTPFTVGASLAALLAGVLVLAIGWWRTGRDRAYSSVYYLNKSPDEKPRPFLAARNVVVEYEPPENLRPAQVGMLLDERADQKDLTATIVDFAARGYVRITEGSSADRWIVFRVKDPDGLLPYERTVFDGMFVAGAECDLSDAPVEYTLALDRAEHQLYEEAVADGWFTANPESVRRRWFGAGAVLFIIGLAGAFVFGGLFGVGLVGLAAAGVGALMAASCSIMPKRTARGSELMRRCLGFRMYVETAEQSRQEFNEKENIFSAYLPYAIVFGSVHKWARAFRDVRVKDLAVDWYSGPAVGLASADFAVHMQAFSHCTRGVAPIVIPAAAATHGTHGWFGGGGGFGGGFGGGGGGGSAGGGGGGGGGGGSW